ncbi:MAG: N-acetylmuramoyl-L-alanine amidase, partial [Rickettsiales bacterium]|nr:N-acetylmuramoyl-L-alanine amidase [Rickettsiales bacterium]
ITQTATGADLKITAKLRRAAAAPNAMLLEPNGDTGWRLVLDFMPGGAAAPVVATPVKTPTKRIIVIDAGHGGRDPGAIGVTGIREKNVVLNTAKKLRAKLAANNKFNVIMTRNSDVFLNLDTRAGIAEKNRADLFISIHANSNPSKSMKGFSIYTLSKVASDEEAQKLADAENAADKIEVDGFEKFEPDIRNALSALQQHAVAELSVDFARGARRSMTSAGIAAQGTTLRSAAFAVLRSTIPGCLIELGHLSNKSEEKLLNTAAHQDKLVNAIAAAINKYNFDV